MKNKVYHGKPQFYDIKIGFKGVKIIKVCFHDAKRRFRRDCELAQSESRLSLAFI